MNEKLQTRECYCTDGKYRLYPIADEDRDDYTELRRQINGDGTFYLNPAIKDIMWEQTLSGHELSYSIFDEADQYCGNFEFQKWDPKHPEIGIDLLESMRNKGICPAVVRIATKTFAQQHDVEYFVIEIMSKNSHSRHVFEKMGVTFVGEEDSLYTKSMKVLEEAAREVGIKSLKDRVREVNPGMEEPEDEIVRVYRMEIAR